MLDVLNKHLHAEPKKCVVSQWIVGLPDDEQTAFNAVMEHNQQIHIASLFKDLSNETKLPFKLTAFRSHIRGYCTCQH